MSLDTDLAVELYRDEINANKLSGVACSERTDRLTGLRITEIDILNNESAVRLQKPIGKYITIESDKPLYEYSPVFNERCKLLAGEIKKVCRSFDSVLFLGLGNRRITPDSIGALTADRVFATRHIKRLAREIDSSELSELSCVAAGVMAQTGVESAQLALAIVNEIKPHQVVVCDALACSEPSHMGRTIQICSSGISPGSGVENSRAEISEATLSVPTMAIGVPTVSRMLDGLIVTPKPIDRLVERASVMIARAVNLCFHPTLTPDEVDSLM